MMNMKDIDLLPECYKNSRRKEVGLRGQYIIIGAMLVFMAFWSFMTGGSVSRAQAKLSKQLPDKVKAESIIHKTRQVRQQIEQLESKVGLLNEIDSGLNIPNVISELSFVVNRNIVLSEVTFVSQKPKEIRQGQSQTSGIRVASRSSGGQDNVPLGNVQFKITIKGIAADTSDVGELVHNLEQSEYFCSVSLLYSRNRRFSSGTRGSQDEKQVSEFEISCYLANYVKDGK